MIKRNEKYTGDGGIDGMAYKDQYTFYIQCKCYGKNQTIKTADVQRLAKLLRRKNDRGLFIHTAKTPSPAFRVARENSIEIISGNLLVELFS